MEELDIIGAFLAYLGLEGLANFVGNVVVQIVKIFILISPIFIWIHLKGIRAEEERRTSQFDKIEEALQDICKALEKTDPNQD